MKNKNQQAGKTFSGILIGLVLAVVVVAGLLWFLNNNKTTFQHQEPAKPEQIREPDILNPPGLNTESSASNQNTDGSTDGSGVVDEGEDTSPPPVVKVEPTQPKIIPKEHKDDAGKKNVDKPIKVSPEDILNSGSLEKAQAKAKKEQSPAVKTSKNVVYQVGSYAKEETADAQRAQLVMLGIDAKIEKAQVGQGKTVYRVKTMPVTEAQAAIVAKNLRSNGIDYLPVSK